MAMNLSDQAQEQAIIQAFSIAGPTATEGDVTRHFFRLLKVLSPESNLRKKLAQVDDVKTIYGTIIGVDKEVGTDNGNGAGPGRGVVIFKSASTHPKWNPRGFEMSRSDLLSSAAARETMNQGKTLIGHRVAATILVLETEGGKVRELALLEDLGEDRNYDPQSPDYAIDYEYLKLKTAKLASHGAR